MITKRIDVSEVKTYRSCHRKWQITSRNAFHLAPKVTPKHFTLGTMFHDALARLYVSKNPESVLNFIKRESADDPDLAALYPMVKGYIDNVWPEDSERYQVLEVEHHFEIPVEASWAKHTKGTAVEADYVICGSIDLIARDKINGRIYGFEHKTCKDFRKESYLWMDEQPRLYTKALQQYCDEHGEQMGCMMLNEVKKLKRTFGHKRTMCEYESAELKHFFEKFLLTCDEITGMPDVNPEPNYFNCSMCDFQEICDTYNYRPLVRDRILENFEDYQVREHDHLDEKLEVSVDEDN